MTTRRRFLAGSVAFVAGAVAPGLPAWAAVESSPRPASPANSASPASPISPARPGQLAGGFELGIQSFSLRRYALEPMLDRVAQLGLRRVELIPELEILFYRLGSHLPIDSDAAAIDRARAALAARGVEISGSGVHSVSDEGDARQLFEFAVRAGIPLLTIAPDDSALEALDRLCRAHPAIRLGIHNHGPYTRYDTIADVEASLVGRAPNFGACVDTGHFIRSGEDPVAALRRLGPRVHGVHLKDFADAGFFASGCLLGEGKLDLVGFFRTLRAIGFGADAALSLEFERDSDDLLEELAENVRRVVAAAELAAVGG